MSNTKVVSLRLGIDTVQFFKDIDPNTDAGKNMKLTLEYLEKFGLETVRNMLGLVPDNIG